MQAVVQLIELLLLALAAVAGISLYLLPSLVAARRGHPHWLTIVIANVLTGWTGFGWIAVLVWACIRPRPVIRGVRFWQR